MSCKSPLLRNTSTLHRHFGGPGLVGLLEFPMLNSDLFRDEHNHFCLIQLSFL